MNWCFVQGKTRALFFLNHVSKLHFVRQPFVSTKKTRTIFRNFSIILVMFSLFCADYLHDGWSGSFPWLILTVEKIPPPSKEKGWEDMKIQLGETIFRRWNWAKLCGARILFSRAATSISLFLSPTNSSKAAKSSSSLSKLRWSCKTIVIDLPYQALHAIPRYNVCPKSISVGTYSCDFLRPRDGLLWGLFFTILKPALAFLMGCEYTKS